MRVSSCSFDWSERNFFDVGTPLGIKEPQRRVLWVAWVWWSAVLGYGYLMWLLKGCRAYMPFISDMGLVGHIPVVFTLGTMVEGFLLGLWLLWATIARCNLLKMLRLRFFLLEFFCALTGLMVVVGTFFIGLFPWDVYSYLHFACACCVFWGGCFYSFFTCLLCQGISCDPRLSGSGSSWRKMYTWLTPLCGLSFFGVYACLMASWDATPDFFSWMWWSKLQALAREDFLGYCGSGSWHGLPWVNSCAFLEWLTLSLLCASMLAGQADIHLYLDIKEGRITLPEDVGSAGHAHPPTATPGNLSQSLARKWWVLLALCSPTLLAVMYVTWVSNGCSKVPPFLSHFGLESNTRWLFSWGVLISDGLLSIWLLHIFASQWQMQTAQGRRGVDVLLYAGFNAAGAMLMVLGLAFVTLLSWDSHFAVHVLSAFMVLTGFGMWSCAMILTSMPDWIGAPPRSLWWLRPLRFLQYFSWAGSLGALALGGLRLSTQALPAMVVGQWTFLAESRHFVLENFREVCGDTRGPTWSAVYALCQWMWAGCMHCFVVCSICDSELYFVAWQVQKDGRATHGMLPLRKRSVLLVALVAAGLLHLSYNVG